MPLSSTLRHSSLALVMSLATSVYASTAEERMHHEIDALKNRLLELEQQLAELKSAKTEIAQAQADAKLARATAEAARQEAEAAQPQIKLGGAVRFQYSNERYNVGNRSRGGDIDFDTFRLNLDGKVKGIILSAEYRWYQYMNAVHHAWVGYDVTPNDRVMVGITKVPFGVLPYNSHSFFFSSNFYLGLEDDYDAGINWHHQDGPWDLRLAYYKNDEMGGIDGYVDNRTHRYSYDVVGYRPAGEGTYATPSKPIAENNTFNARVAYKFEFNDKANLELGLSGRQGQLVDATSKVGNESAYAIHMVGNYDRWNLQLQATTYKYKLDNGANRLAVGAYAFYDTIASKANTYTANLAYSLPVSLGPISNLTFYNDYSLVNHKSAGLSDSWMNVTGMAITAGDLYSYIDYVVAQNQPFIGGTMDSTGGETERRLNINVGYYF